ncbi:hypothetical protein EV279_1280 [Microbacterium sp. BK668]|nr:hypothetical protein EV279_1280 [Microbacterium sp. BK668]
MAVAPLASLATYDIGSFVPVAALLGPALYSASLVIFAVGSNGKGRITGDRKLGAVSLVILAVVMFATAAFWVAVSRHPSPGPLMAFGIAATVVEFALALAAVVEIKRARVVRRPWCDAPLWALIAVSATWLIPNIINATGTAQADIVTAMAFGTVEGFLRMALPILLGGLAILLAHIPATEKTVEVL